MSDTTKNIEFKVKLNAEEANKQIADLQAKLREISKNSGYSDRSKQAYGEDSSISKDSQAVFQKQQTAVVKNLKDRQSGLEKELELVDKISKRNLEGSKVDIKAQQTKLDLMTKHLLIQEQINKLGGGATSAGGYGGAAGGGYTGGAGGIPTGFGTGAPGAVTPPPPPTESGGGFFNDLISSQVGKMMTAGAVVGMITKVAQGTVAEIANTFSFDQNKTRQNASIAQSQVQSSGMAESMSGLGIESSMFDSQKKTARTQAEKAYKGQRISEGKYELGGRLAAWLQGMGGTAVEEYGAGIGGLLTGGTEATAGMRGRLSNLFDTGSFKGGKKASDEAKERYKSEQVEKDTSANYQALKQQAPLVTASAQYFEQNKRKMLQAQQAAGMTDNQLNNTLGSGGGNYTEDQKYGMMQGIANAGGSSAQMRSGKEGLDLTRGYGIQNAAGIMGTLSHGLTGGATAGDSVTERILAKAFSIGLDASNFSRETEKFVQQSAQFISDSGAKTVEAQARVESLDIATGTGSSMRDVEAAGSSRQQFEDKLGEGADPLSKALQLSAMRKNPKLSKLSESMKTRLANLGPGKIQAGGMEIQDLATTAGYSTLEEFQSDMLGPSGVKSFGGTRTSDQDKNLKDIATMQSKYGSIFNQETLDKKGEDLQKQIKEAKTPAESKIAQDKLDEYKSDMLKLPEMRAKGTSMGFATGDFGGTYEEGAGVLSRKAGLEMTAAQKSSLSGGLDTAPRIKTGLAQAGVDAEAKEQILKFTDVYEKHAGAYKTASESILTHTSTWITALVRMEQAMAGKDVSAQDAAKQGLINAGAADAAKSTGKANVKGKNH